MKKEQITSASNISDPSEKSNMFLSSKSLPVTVAWLLDLGFEKTLTKCDW